MTLPSTRLGLQGVETLIVDDNSQSLAAATNDCCWCVFVLSMRVFQQLPGGV